MAAKPRRHRLATFLAVLAALLAVVVALGPTVGRVRLDPWRRAGADRDVRILRDTWGVPHVFGKTDADAAYGLAWAHAEDDFATIQPRLLATRGRLASVIGREGAPNDYVVALLRVRETVDAKYATDLSPEVRAVCEAYAEGINRYAALHPAEAIPSLYPVTGKDVVAGFVQAVPFFFGLEKVLAELMQPTRFRPVSIKGEAASPSDAVAEPTGSNTIAVAPSRSADGFPRLAVNSHQPWDGAFSWYEAHVHSEEGWNATGGLFPGAPLILHGHNPDLGWAFVVNSPDLVDVYVLATDPSNPNRYRFDGQWRDLEVRRASLDVRLFGSFRWSFGQDLLWSVHGPVVRRPHGTYAIRYANMGDVRAVEQWFRMNKARNREEWEDAMRLGAIPSFDIGYADREGHIEYVYNARLPRRAEGYDWKQYLPGDTSETLWTEYLPFDELPRVVDPPSGFVVNANSTPFEVTVGPGNPDSARYSKTFGIETRFTNRELRALELFGNDREITREAFERYKFDTAYSKRSTTALRLQSLVTGPPPADPLAHRGFELLQRWDLNANVENPAAALALMTMSPPHDNQPRPIAHDELVRRLERAAHDLQDTFGRLDVPLGEVTRLRRGTVDLPVGGGPDTLRAIYTERDGDGRRRAIVGDSYILLVEWDRAGKVSSRSIHQYGSATSRPDSPHYADQSPLFARCELKPVWLDEADIRAHLEREYRPGQSDRADRH
jgi:penicillin amidase/acyl-homoserine-lactone acylase